MNELVSIQYKNSQPTVLGRDLHAALEVKTPYDKWFPRMAEYGFDESLDFSTFLSESTGGRPTFIHQLTIDMAKELCMLQRTAKGKECRRYFIEIEKRWNSPGKRVFLVGLKDKEFIFPEIKLEQITCEMALSDLPPLEKGLGKKVMDYPIKPQNDYQKMMRENSKKVLNHVAANHTERIRKIISLVPDGGNYKDLPYEYQGIRNFNVAWTRFASDKPAPKKSKSSGKD